MKKTYTVRYERDEDGWWVASVVGVRGCHTQGKSIAQARERIREALGLFIPNAKTVELEDDILLSADIRKRLKAYVRERSLIEARENEVMARLRDTIAKLKRDKVSVRDQSEILKLSKSRVDQIARELQG
jgi:predicted RNase H-like HicB family nuclease